MQCVRASVWEGGTSALAAGVAGEHTQCVTSCLWSCRPHSYFGGFTHSSIHPSIRLSTHPFIVFINPSTHPFVHIVNQQTPP